jgi:cold shock CspA family protein
MRGFGFIKPTDGGEDLFCHVSSIRVIVFATGPPLVCHLASTPSVTDHPKTVQDGNMLRDGDTVEYEEAWDDRKGKYMADNVTGGCREEDQGRGRGGGRDRDDRRYDDRYDDRRRDRYDDRYDDRRRDRDYDRRDRY